MQSWRFLKTCNSGVALLEFAIALPIMLTMLIGMIEATRFTIINQKLDKVANAMADFVTQSITIGVGNLDAFAQAVAPIMQPFAFSGTIVFTSVASFAGPTPPCAVANTPCITWQHKELGNSASQVGTNVGGSAVIPNGYTMSAGGNIIIAEAFMTYTPLLNATSTLISAFNAQTLYKVAVYKPRQGSLTTLGP